MKTKHFIYVVFTVIIIVALSYYFYDTKSREAQAPEANIEEMIKQDSKQNLGKEKAIPAKPSGGEFNNNTQRNGQGVKDLSKQAEGTFSSGEEQVLSPDILVVEVIYDGNSYTPNTVNILAGDVVIFKNESAESFWPASNNHPTHTIYPEFDPKRPIPAGGSFKFKFERVGSWGFHDHLNPSVGGVINVGRR